MRAVLPATSSKVKSSPRALGSCSNRRVLRAAPLSRNLNEAVYPTFQRNLRWARRVAAIGIELAHAHSDFEFHTECAGERSVPLTYVFELVVRVLRWPFLALFVLIAISFLYRYGPWRRNAKWHWVSLGALFATVVWLGASAGFSIYVSNFAHYDKLYGSLGAVIILLLWLYISFYIVLRGAELNAELELQTAKDTTSGRPRPMGSRGAFVADHVAGGPKGNKRPISEWQRSRRQPSPTTTS